MNDIEKINALKSEGSKSVMVEQIEISSLDLRYEGYRLKSGGTEKRLLASIIEHGIREPLQGVDIDDDCRILLNGFKRCRCAHKLKINIVPYRSFGVDEPMGIIKLINLSNSKNLNILEQAKLIDELQNRHNMSCSDIAGLLEKSKTWVSVRAGIIGEISDYVMKRIFKGDFPVYSYMYTLRRFIRINSITKNDIDEFVKSVAGKGLSIRDIELLANGYFKGGEDFRQQIKGGNITWGLRRLKEASPPTTDCSELERNMLKDFEFTQKYMQRVTYKSKDDRLSSNSFYVQANLITGVILKQLDMFSKAIRDFHDRSGQA